MTEIIDSETNFSSISIAEFFYRNRQMAGFGNPTQAVYSTVRELVENSLDACEDARRFPEIKIDISQESVDTITITVSDNGTGVPYEFVPEAFGKVLYGSKYGIRQKRGTFGLGVTMAILYGQLTTGCPVTIKTRTDTSEAKSFKIFIDIERNLPIVDDEHQIDQSEPGTTVSLSLKGAIKRAQQRILEYLRLTSLATPHTRMQLTINQNVVYWYERIVTKLPDSPILLKPHPRAADIEFLRRLISKSKNRSLQSFLIESFQQVGERNATRFLNFLALDKSRKVSTLTREEVYRISNALRKYDGFSTPNGRCLSPIGHDAFTTSVAFHHPDSEISYVSRGPSEWDGNPFIIEGVIALNTDCEQPDNPNLYRFANKVPLLYDASEDVLTKVLHKVNWSRYGIGNNLSAIIYVNLCSTRVPYKAAGKQSISANAKIEDEAVALFRSLGRSVSKIAKRVAKSKRNMKRIREFSKHFRTIAKFGAELAEFPHVPETAQLVRTLFEVEIDET